MKSPARFLDRGRDFGLLVLRLVVGATFVYYGWMKIMGGNSVWSGVGSAAGNFGFKEGYVYWGFGVALVELLGGVALVLGMMVRPAALLIFCVMVGATALKFHGLDLGSGDSASDLFYPASIAAVMVSLFFSGGGRFAAGARGRKTSSLEPKQGE